MSCYNNNTSPCCQEIPYPQISSESVPSLIENLVYALYGTINKTIVNGRVIWDIPCDPNNTAEIDNVPREEGEGLLCYLIRVFNETFGAGSPFARWGFSGSGTNTFTLNGATLTNEYGYLVYIDGVVQDPINFTITGFPNPVLTLSEPVLTGSYITIIQHQFASLPPTNFGNSWSYTGNGIQTVFAITGGSSILPQAYLVHVDGVYQKSTNYTINNAIPRTLTFSTPIPSGSEITILSLSVA